VIAFVTSDIGLMLLAGLLFLGVILAISLPILFPRRPPANARSRPRVPGMIASPQTQYEKVFR
jgi:hypothetical protein